MSHLSILPTVFTRLDLLETALGLEGFDVIRHGVLPDFGRAPRSVDLLALRDGSRPMGWCIDDQGVIRLHGDLQRIPGLSSRLQRLSRRYALLSAIDSLQSLDLPTAEFSLGQC